MKRSWVFFRLLLLFALFNILKSNNQVKKLIDFKNIEVLNQNNFIDFTFATEKIHKFITKGRNVEKLIKNANVPNNSKSDKGTVSFLYYFFFIINTNQVKD